MAYVAIDHRGIGPVGLERDDAEAVPLDQPPGDRRARAIELRRAVAGLAEQHHAAVGIAVEALGEGGIVDVGQRFDRLAQACGQPGLRRARLDRGWRRRAGRGCRVGLAMHGDVLHGRCSAGRRRARINAA